MDLPCRKQPSSIHRSNLRDLAGRLQSCGDLSQGKWIHARLITAGFADDLFPGNLLVSMYSNCSSVVDARTKFDRMQTRDVITWTSMIKAYSQHGHGRVGLELYRTMLCEGPRPNSVTLLTVVGICVNFNALAEGKLVHLQIHNEKLQIDAVLGTSLVCLYAGCSNLQSAALVFDGIHVRDVGLWNALISGYVKQGCVMEALRLLSQMQLEGMTPDTITFINILASAENMLFAEGKLIHSYTIQHGVASVLVVGNALLNLYSKYSSLQDTSIVFDRMCKRDVRSWTAIVSVFVHNSEFRKGLQAFQLMRQDGIMADCIAYIGALEACAGLSALEDGKAIHVSILRCEDGMSINLGNALINMYGRCGSLENAKSVFKAMPKHDIVSWNAIIGANSKHGYGYEAIGFFHQMMKAGMQPNSITFICILTAFSHAGFFDEGHHYLVYMSKDHGLPQIAEHYGCIIYLLGFTKWLLEAEDLINSMPTQAGAVTWTTFLNACRIHGDVKRGRRAAEGALHFDPGDAGIYVLIADMCAEQGIGNIFASEPSHGLQELDETVKC